MTFKLIKKRADLHQCPSQKDIYPLAKGNTVVFGDLHANPLKLLNGLMLVDGLRVSEENKKIYEGTKPENPDSQTKGFVDNTLIPIEDLTKEDYQPSKDNLQKLVTTDTVNNEIKPILIGDIFSDRYTNDAYMVETLKTLMINGMSFDILISNHDLDFILTFEKDSSSPFETTLLMMGGHAPSLENLQTFLQKLEASPDQTDIPLTKQDIHDFYHTYYKPNLKLVHYSLSDDKKEIIIYSHAGIGRSTIESIAKHPKINVSYDLKSAESIAKTIDAINQKFQEYVQKNEVYSLFDPNVLYLAYSGQPIDPEKFPLEFSIWNRKYGDLDRPEKLEDGSICRWLHGHDSNDPKENDTYIINLDNLVGKGPSFHSTAMLEIAMSQRGTELPPARTHQTLLVFSPSHNLADENKTEVTQERKITDEKTTEEGKEEVTEEKEKIIEEEKTKTLPEKSQEIMHASGMIEALLKEIDLKEIDSLLSEDIWHVIENKDISLENSEKIKILNQIFVYFSDEFEKNSWAEDFEFFNERVHLLSLYINDEGYTGTLNQVKFYSSFFEEKIPEFKNCFISLVGKSVNVDNDYRLGFNLDKISIKALKEILLGQTLKDVKERKPEIEEPEEEKEQESPLSAEKIEINEEELEEEEESSSSAEETRMLPEIEDIKRKEKETVEVLSTNKKTLFEKHQNHEKKERLFNKIFEQPSYLDEEGNKAFFWKESLETKLIKENDHFYYLYTEDDTIAYGPRKDIDRLIAALPQQLSSYFLINGNNDEFNLGINLTLVPIDTLKEILNPFSEENTSILSEKESPPSATERSIEFEEEEDKEKTEEEILLEVRVIQGKSKKQKEQSKNDQPEKKQSEEKQPEEEQSKNELQTLIKAAEKRKQQERKSLDSEEEDKQNQEEENLIEKSKKLKKNEMEMQEFTLGSRDKKLGENRYAFLDPRAKGERMIRSSRENPREESCCKCVLY